MNLDSPTTVICLAQFCGDTVVMRKEFHEPDSRQYLKWAVWIKETMREHSFIDHGSISLRWGDRQMIGLGIYKGAFILCRVGIDNSLSLVALFDNPCNEEHFEEVAAQLSDVASDDDRIPALIRMLYNPRAS